MIHLDIFIRFWRTGLDKIACTHLLVCSALLCFTIIYMNLQQCHEVMVMVMNTCMYEEISKGELAKSFMLAVRV